MSSNLKDMIPKIEVSLTSAAFEEAGQRFIDAGIMDTDAVVAIFMRLKAYSVRSRKNQARAKKAGPGSSGGKAAKASGKTKKSKQPKPMTKEQKKGNARLLSKVNAFTKIVGHVGPKIADDAMFALGSGTEASIKGVKDLSYVIAGPYGQRLGLNDLFKTAVEKVSQRQDVQEQAGVLKSQNDKIANPVRSVAIQTILKEAGLDKHESDASRMFFPSAQVLPKSKWRQEDLTPTDSNAGSEGGTSISSASTTGTLSHEVTGSVAVDYGGRPGSPHSQGKGGEPVRRTQKRTDGSQSSTQTKPKPSNEGSGS